MYPLNNKYMEMLDDTMKECDYDAEDGFGYRYCYFSQILESRNMIFDEMCKKTGVTDYKDLQFAHLKKQSISKDQLCEWLETVCCVLDSYAAPVMGQAQLKIEKLTKENDQLKNEKISDQQRIIELQQQVIEKKDVELQSVKLSVQSTVETEMKTYASAISSTCSKALAPKKLTAALKSAAVEEDRSRNLVIYGLKEEKEEQLEQKIHSVLLHLDEKPRIISSCRMGKEAADGAPAPSRVKPIKFTLAETSHVRQILRKTKLLRTVEGYKDVYICPDRSAESRLAYKKLLDQLKQKRIEEPFKNHVIKNNMIMSSEKPSD